jgi:hypothetical protein
MDILNFPKNNFILGPLGFMLVTEILPTLLKRHNLFEKAMILS